jgi:anti-sigma regulatory factor (Ser/Thr protein kinase)
MVRAKSNEIRQFILNSVDAHPHDLTAFTAAHWGITRPAVLRHIHQLIADGVLLAQGTTRDRHYSVKPIAQRTFEVALAAGLDEDTVWRRDVRPLLDGVASNVLGICQYGFTEMLNNAISHSEGAVATIGVIRTLASITLTIADDGVGIFGKIARDLCLDEPLHAILELSKGKLTTDPEHHSGEGIYFASRMFDEFAIRSGRLAYRHTMATGDWLSEDQDEEMRGTLVRMTIAAASSRRAKEVFDASTTDDDYGFTKTQVPVRLARYGDENLVSRSQARRLLNRFDRFQEVVLDFQGVDSIGQGFADEIFRVWVREHPRVHVTYVNADPDVEKMIRRAGTL